MRSAQNRLLTRAARLGLLVSAGLIGCTNPAPPATFASKPFTVDGTPGTLIASRNFNLHTTVESPARRTQLIQTLEAAHAAYQSLLPTAGRSEPPITAYVFANRSSWARFTASRTGSSAAIFLQIRRGGFAQDDWFAAYDIAEFDTLSVISHEGWHGFSARHFKTRLPPFVEEGLATWFETVRIQGDRVWIDVGENAARQRRLARAVEAGGLLTLRQTLATHAGMLIGHPDAAERFYAHGWAFTRYLHERRPAALRAWLAAAAAGTVVSEDPVAAVEHYTGARFETIEKELAQFVADVVSRIEE